jgi:serine/threonine-protein kinase
MKSPSGNDESPVQSSPLSAERWQEITRVVSAFEAAWQAGNPPRLEDLVGAAVPEARPELFRQLLRLEAELRREQGKPLTAREAEQRFAGLGSWAGSVLAGLGLDTATAVLVLDVTAGPRAGRSFQLPGHGNFLVGRGPDGVTVAVGDEDKGISRVHFLLESNPPLARLFDLRSRNGTFLNGTRVEQADLRDGDAIQAGQTHFQVHLPRGEQTVTLEGAPIVTTSALPGRPAIPGFRLAEELGRGGMGIVYRAVRLADNRVTAVKVVLPAVAPRPETLARFQREIALLQRLSHPHIVAILDLGDTAGLLYFVMEHIEGPNAAQLVRDNGPLAPERVIRLGSQLLDALAHAHLQGIVHRDIKPGNVLVTGPAGAELLKLADFGLARAYHESAMSGLSVAGQGGGTPGYIAPEQLRDFHAARPAADQYSAAATLYFLVTGQPIYEVERKAVDQLLRMLNDEPRPLRQPPEGPPLPGRLGEVIRRGLARDPRARYPDVVAMRHALERARS